MDFLNRYDNIPRTNGKCLTEIERNKITLCLGAGLNNTEIARELHFDVRTVNKRVQRFAETGIVFYYFACCLFDQYFV
jgi:DNA-binding NarL/FixJ family response regulator